MSVPTSIEAFYKDAKQSLLAFNEFAIRHKLEGRALPDHLCYKCGSRTSFERLRKMFEDAGCWMFESRISDRTIAYIRLNFEIPMTTGLGEIRYLELCDQKPDRSQRSGFDHVEVYATAMSYEEMVEELAQTEQVVEKKRPHHSTHDIDVGNGFLFRATHGPLVEKIKNEEMI